MSPPADVDEEARASLLPEDPVLLVDDEIAWLRTLSLLLDDAGISNVLAERDSTVVPALAGERPISVAVFDLNMPGLSGSDLLDIFHANHPDVPVIIVTGTGEVKLAVECMKKGAFDYFVKSDERQRFVAAVKNAVALQEARRENASLKERVLDARVRHPGWFGDIVTASSRMLAVFRYVEATAATSEPFLVTGESGVGKELIAQAIHRASGRRGSLVAVNVAGLDDAVFADTLFGHRRGAFTGAIETRKGLVEEATGGTLFLDEIGDLSTSSQLKLLRLIEQHEYLPVGSDAAKRTDARIVVATNRSLTELRDGSFRRDLFFRLKTHHVHVPPLRERREDIHALVDCFLERAAKELGKPLPSVPPALYDLLSTYEFPGKVRELRGLVFDAVSSHSRGVLSLDAFRRGIRAATGEPTREHDDPGRDSPAMQFGERLPTLREASRALIDEALRRANGNQRVAAELLGITRQALNKRLKNHPS